MDVRYLILSLLFLVSCMPTADVGRSNSVSSSTDDSDTDTTSSVSGVSWNYLGSTASNIIINVSNLNNAYLVGTSVENYLATSANFSNANYCLVTRYNLGGTTLELRSRAVPVSYYDFTAKRTVKIIRVDFQDVTNSSSFCSASLRTQDTNGVYTVDTTVPSGYKFDPNLLCPTCTSMLQTTSVKLFQLGATYLDEVPKTTINTNNITMQVDPNYAVNGSGSYTNAECVARGYNCALENQCVNDGAVRPTAYAQYPTQLQAAEIEKLTNPRAYLSYPHLYYICGTSVPTTGGSGSGSTTGSTTSGSTGGDYTEGLTQLKKDYYCIEHIKSQASVSPFHSEILTGTFTAATDCLTASSDSAENMYYQNVIKRMYQTCGCAQSTLADMINNCPNYEYSVTSYNSANVPTQIDCYTPNSNTNPVPSQQTVNVNSRSAPHRFFESINGLEKDILGSEKTYISNGTTYNYEQEGAAFSYLDEDTKVLPSQSNFSMNAILGQMSVNLDKALPAKKVSVELDQVYLISTTSGYYTPCPSCGKDSWLGSFSAFSSSSTGTGLQAIGHTTQRDALSTNTTSGNYEDTIFGRACWVPPTMLPFSHSSKTTIKEQRLNRLQTQAALYANGYQRDWYGFNKGALIGSFDGVTWFAIGKGRIVRSTSTKLFLAINAPFADVASPSTHVVNVQAYDGITTAAQVDYDPQYHQYHPYQNEAGNCQKFHMCSTDTDCVSKLGWEYACADISDIKTKWPTFDSQGNESGTMSNAIGLDQILQQKRLSSSSAKRCVYRGAGALCLVNAGTAVTDLNKKKVLTCAPNFYCANVNTSGVFNGKVARFAAKLENIPVARNHLFGKDANVMGRPLNYVASSDSTTLLTNIKSTLSENLQSFETQGASYTGLCQPGKALPTAATPNLDNPFNQQMSKDTNNRTDFISQIGSCNSGLFTTSRHASCPVIGTDGNFEMFSASTLPTDYKAKASSQNSCGLESLATTANLGSSADTLSSYSPFKAIEAKPLSSQIILDKTLVRDACLRRAGAVCHTDLDCSPNKLHASQVDFYGTSYFGNLPEKTYHSEYLVCGQADPKPYPSDTAAYDAYDMTKNRCCREVGLDLTTYTSDIPTSTAAGNYDADTAGLKMKLSPGTAPNDPKRYSRLSSVLNIGTTERPILTAYQERTSGGLIQNNPQGYSVRSPNQWKTLTVANSQTCCGGGWIRKFSDGTTNWSKRDRFYMDVTNFACINSRTPLITDPAALAQSYNNNATYAQNLVTADYSDYCKDGTNTKGACAQYSISSLTGEVPPSADSYSPITINTISPDYGSSNPDYYFTPRSADGNVSVIVDFASTDPNTRKNIAIKMPSYVPYAFDVDYASATPAYEVRVENASGSGHTCTKVHGFPFASYITEYTGAANCIYTYDTTTRVLKVGPRASSFGSEKVGVVINNLPNPANTVVTRNKPGNSTYYLKRLGRFELSGIPQIVYEPLYCSDNIERLVPGIFSAAITTRTAFQNINFSFIHGGTRYTNSKGLLNEPIFAANDFKCCMPLGKSTKTPSKCCSGYGIPDGTNGTTYTCGLPAGTDLMVYFNPFVSNEGMGADKPGGGILETEFDAFTGEPNTEATVIDKIRTLGITYCQSGKVRQGGAFGEFEPEPQGSETDLTSKIYNIVDSSRDSGQNSNSGSTVTTGYTPFMDGFRWNHHLYCDD